MLGRTLNRRRARGRAILSVLGIALGVALGYGVSLVNRAAVDDLAAAVRTLSGEADLQVRGGREGFAESLYPLVARLPGVASASAGLELDAGLAGAERTIRIVGIDEVDPANGCVSWISPIARALIKAREGDVVRLRTPAGEEKLEILHGEYP